MQYRLGCGADGHSLGYLGKTWCGYSDCVFPDGNGVKKKLPVLVGVGGLRPIGRICAQHDHCSLQWTMLRIVNNAAHRTKNGSVGNNGRQQNEEWRSNL